MGEPYRVSRRKPGTVQPLTINPEPDNTPNPHQPPTNPQNNPQPHRHTRPTTPPHASIGGFRLKGVLGGGPGGTPPPKKGDYIFSLTLGGAGR